MGTDHRFARRGLVRLPRTAVCSALVAAAVLATGGVPTGVRAASPSMYVDPPSQNVALAGAPVTVTVGIHDVSDLVSWEFAISYDPSVLTFVSAQQDKTLLATIGSPFCPAPIVDEVSGSVRMGCVTGGVSTQGGVGANGSGALGTMTFAPKAAGMSQMGFTRLEFGTPQDTDIIATPAQGVIRVLAAGESGGTLAPTPTVNPVALTPTPITGQPTPDAGVILPASSTGSTQGAPSSAPSGDAGSGGRTSQAEGRSTSGDQAAISSGNGASGAPHAGDGSATRRDGRDRVPLIAAIALGVGGMILAFAGRVARRRKT